MNTDYDYLYGCKKKKEKKKGQMCKNGTKMVTLKNPVGSTEEEKILN